MTFDQLYEAIYDWVDAVVNEGSPATPVPIIQSHQNVPAPTTGDVYLVIGYTPTTVMREGWADSEDVDVDEETLAVKTDYQGVVEIREVNGSGQNLKMLVSSLLRQDFKDLLSAKGIHYRGEEPIVQLPRLQDNLWEKESILEIRFGFADEVVYTPGVIETAEISGQIEDRDIVVSAPVLYEQDFAIADGPVPDWSVISSTPAGLGFNVVSGQGVLAFPVHTSNPSIEVVYNLGMSWGNISFGVRYRSHSGIVTGILLQVRAQGVVNQAYNIWIRDVNTANPYIQSFDIDGYPSAPIELNADDIFRVVVMGEDPIYIGVYQNDNLIISGQRTPAGGPPPRTMRPLGSVGIKVTGSTGYAGQLNVDDIMVIQK